MKTSSWLRAYVITLQMLNSSLLNITHHFSILLIITKNVTQHFSTISFFFLPGQFSIDNRCVIHRKLTNTGLIWFKEILI